MYSSNYTYPVRYEGQSRESFQEEPSILSPEAAFNLIRDSVEVARRGQQSLAGSERVREGVKLKLTIDLSHQSIEQMPNEVVELLKRDVERYGCATTAGGARALRQSPSKIQRGDNADIPHVP